MPTWDERMNGRPEPEPRLELLLTAWQFRAPSGKVLSCGLYRTEVPGFEVRVGYAPEELLYSTLVWDVDCRPTRSVTRSGTGG